MTQSNKSKAHAKLNDSATGSGQNLDQVLYFGLVEQIQDICISRAQQFAEHGLTQHDVLEEIKSILTQGEIDLNQNHGDEMNTTSKDLINLVETHTLTGTVIDVSAMEASGGGLYPSYQAVKGQINKVLSEDIGEEAYDLTDLSLENPSQVPPNTWAFYFGDEGPTLRSLNNGNEHVLNVQQ